MKNGIKAISLALSAVLCLGMLTQHNLKEVSADIGGANSDYALSMMGKYATITQDDFYNGPSSANHSMAPIAVGGDYKSPLAQLTDNRGMNYFRDLQYDLVIGGKISTSDNKVGVSLNSANGLADYEIAVVDGNIDKSQFYYLYNESMNDQLQGVVKSYAKDNLPVDFDSLYTGFGELSKSIDDFAKNDPSAIQVDVINSTATLVGTGEYNVFNVTSTNFNKVVINIPKGSHAIVNIPGSVSHVDVEMNYISNIKDVDGVLTYDSEVAVTSADQGEDSLYKANVIYLNQNVIFNSCNATTIGDFKNGTILAPNATFTTGGGNTNGGLFVKSYSSDSGIEFHGGNIGGSFTWVKSIVSIKCNVTVSKLAVMGDYSGKDVPGAELTLTGVDFNGNPINMAAASLSLGAGASTVNITSSELTWKTGSTATTVLGLTEGIYTIHEVNAPAGYNTTDDVNFLVKSGNVYYGAVIDDNLKLADNNIKMYDVSYTDIKISKEAAGGEYDGKELPGAHLKLTIVSLDDSTLDFAFTSSNIELGQDAVLNTTFAGGSSETLEWVSGNSPTYIKGLPNGSYILTEELNPIGYQYASDMPFTIKDGNVELVKMIDVVEPTPEPTPIVTPEPTPEVTPEPIVTPEPTPEVTPEPIVTPEPTPEVTPEPIVTPEPTPEVTPEPIVTPEPTPEVTPEPIVTPEPTPEITPEPIVIPDPTPEVTPEPVVTPEPTPEVTPEPIVTPEPTPEVTPEPIVTPEPTPEVTPEPIVTPEPTPEVTPEPVVTPEITPEPTPVVPGTLVVEPVVVPEVVPEVIPVITPEPVVNIETLKPVTPVVTPEPTEEPTPEVTPEVTTVPEEVVVDSVEVPEVTVEEKTPTVADSIEIPEKAVASSTSVSIPEPEEAPVTPSSTTGIETSITSTGESESMSMILGIGALLLAAMIAVAEYFYNKRTRKDYTFHK